VIHQAIASNLAEGYHDMTGTSPHPIRVFQVATGNVGSEMIRRIGQHRTWS
jgi:hypothetical protein